MQMERRISFNPVDPYIPGVRMTVITGYNRPLLWAEDLIAVASGKDRRYARDVLRHKPKLRLIVKRLDANGGRNTKLISAVKTRSSWSWSSLVQLQLGSVSRQ